MIDISAAFAAIFSDGYAMEWDWYGDGSQSLMAWSIALLSSFFIGISKSGFKGISLVFITLMALVFGAKASTGIILPILISADILAVIYYQKHTQWKILFRLLPWMVAGVLLGTWIGKDLPEATFKMGMAIIIIISVLMMWWWDRQKDAKIPTHWGFAGIMGIAAGFCTMVGNLAGAFSNIFFLAIRLPKEDFIGTAAWLFMIINVVKCPLHYFSWGTISPDTLMINLKMIPAAFLGFFIGAIFIKKIKDHHYRKMILILTFIGALIILMR